MDGVEQGDRLFRLVRLQLPDKMQADFIGANEGNPWGGMAEQVLPGIGSLLVTFAIVNSSIANANAGANASTPRAGAAPSAAPASP